MNVQQYRTIIFAACGLAVATGIFLLLSSLVVVVVYGAEGGTGKAEYMYEDQFMLCNFEEECFVFDQDDYLSNSQIDEFQLFFDNDMDTFGLDDCGARC